MKDKINKTPQTNKPDQSAEKIAELTNDLQRTRADFENFRKQVDAQKHQAIESAKYATVAAILPLLDQLKLAIATYSEQLDPLAKTFANTLDDFELQEIATTPGTDFDPNLHEAVMVEDGDGEKELIAETLRPGYLYKGEILRPAMVKVKRV